MHVCEHMISIKWPFFEEEYKKKLLKNPINNFEFSRYCFHSCAGSQSLILYICVIMQPTLFLILCNSYLCIILCSSSIPILVVKCG